MNKEEPDDRRHTCLHRTRAGPHHRINDNSAPGASAPACGIMMDTAILQTFAYIIEEGSFAAAARRMGISKSMCSKHINDLEASLGARLLTRTTRSVKPTPLGIEYHAKVQRILDLLHEANEQVKTQTAKAAGPLKIGFPASNAVSTLYPDLLKFMETFPEIQLEAVLDDNCTDLVSESYDAVIRIGELDDTSMIVRKLDSIPTYVVASPEYLERHGTPQRPSDLAQHRALHYTNMRGSGTWAFRLGREVMHQKIHPTFASNNGDVIRAAALAGQGVAYQPEFLVKDDLASGRLVQILAEYRMPDLPLSVVYPSRRNPSAALRAFIDFTLGLYRSGRAAQPAKPAPRNIGFPGRADRGDTYGSAALG